MELPRCPLKQRGNEGFAYTATAEGVRDIEPAQAPGRTIRNVRVDVQTADSQKSSVVSDC